MSDITVSVFDEHAPTRERLAALINDAPEFQCLATYSSREATLKGVLATPPDVALIAVDLPNGPELELLTQLRTAAPTVRKVMLIAEEQPDLIFAGLRAGASGYLRKDLPPDELIATLKQLHEGGSPMSMPVARKVVDFFHAARPRDEHIAKLTEREHEILELLANGLRYKEIAEKLNLSLNTIRTHAAHIYQKLQVDSRTEATVKYMRQRPGP